MTFKSFGEKYQFTIESVWYHTNLVGSPGTFVDLLHGVRGLLSDWLVFWILKASGRQYSDRLICNPAKCRRDLEGKN